MLTASGAESAEDKLAVRPATAATARSSAAAIPNGGKDKSAQMEKLRQALLFAEAEKERLERRLRAVNRERARPTSSGFERTASGDARQRNKDRR